MRRSANPAGHVNSIRSLASTRVPTARGLDGRDGTLCEAHFATYPPALIEPCTSAGGPEAARCSNPFLGAGTTALVADRLGGHCHRIELSPSCAARAPPASAVRPLAAAA